MKASRILRHLFESNLNVVCRATFSSFATMTQMHAFVGAVGPGICGKSNALGRYRCAAVVMNMDVPEAGLIENAGVTGTTCANLWPIPILGKYGWFLNVYRRDAAERIGGFRVRVPRQGSLNLSFTTEDNMKRCNEHRSFNGIATSKFNIAAAVKSLDEMSQTHEVLMREGDGLSNFWSQRNEVRVAPFSESGMSSLWTDATPSFAVRERDSTFEIREYFSGNGEQPRGATALEYFGMNLSPIVPFQDYSCVVCVWRQHASTCCVAIDKVAKSVHLSFFDARKLSVDNMDEGKPLGQFAVRSFIGGVTDATAFREHAQLLAAIDASNSFDAVSCIDYRIVVSNAPQTLTAKRKCEIMVEVQRRKVE